MSADPQGECSVSLSKTLTLTLPKEKFTQKSSALVKCVYVPPSYIFAGAKSGTLYRWTIPEKLDNPVLLPSYEVTEHEGVISVLYWSTTLQLLFSAGADRKVLVWNLGQKTIPEHPLVQTISVFEQTPLHIEAFQKHIFVVEMRGITVLVQQTLRGTMKSVSLFKKVHFIESRTPFFCMCIYSNSRVDNSGYIYAGFENGSIAQYEVQLSDHPTFTQINRPKHLADHGICDIVYNPRTENILAFSYNHIIRVFNPKNYCIHSKIINPNQVNYTSYFCTKQGTLVLLDTSGSLFIYNAEERITLLYTEKLGLGGLQITPVSKDTFLYLVRDSVTLFRINRGTVEKSYKVHNKSVFYVKTTRDQANDVISTIGVDKVIRTWDRNDFSMRSEFKIPTHLAILSGYIGLRERLIGDLIYAITGHDNGQIIYLNLTDKKNVELPSRHKNSISSMSVVSNEMKTVMFSCDYDGYISLWQIDAIFESLSYAAVSMVKMWKGHNKEILTSSATWMCGQLTLATGGNDNIIKIWRENDGGTFVETQLLGHTDSITSLEFDGFFLFSGSEDFSVRIWDIENNVQLFVLNNLHTHAIRQVFPVYDENKFASCDAGGSIYIYDYVKKQVVWEMHHTTDCTAIYIDKGMETLFACVRKELIPHKMPPGKVFRQGLPSIMPLKSQLSIIMK
ncbi:hypothetical protein TVAG_283170 [Trichomonas vaginalis G3]|uniref:WD repeat protein n=1 Tax=Trichomonas vaginalis (strain ATCC PRA-98 / G3) TaxID=412133 RepID=A2DEM0_TRIV3|nr:SCF-dependent proteasomal ubiquitin-dependent protein catabolic process [Trichomonas vaginalis G3]EAY21147.1 hypothetical protein TVAG_283170 [Trichomonas vaginalis G3]KAI5522328.1 SCF-dependent proteasomal ubiquitin-dependent protein catabolic process [Trichomonas vaginalis G3]|eukprot:XP_001582133.1 hypothetical protein [Trichomonas vaginalis G3]